MLPKLIVFRRISVDGFRWAAMDRKIGLPIAVEVQPAQRNTPGHWFFEDSGGNRLSVMQNQSGQAYIDRDQSHRHLERDIFTPMPEDLAHPDQFTKKLVHAFHLNLFVFDFPGLIKKVLRFGKVAVPKDRDQA